MNDKRNRSDHKFPAPWRHHEPTQDDFDEALRIFQMDGQLENPDRIYPYEFSIEDRDRIVQCLPNDTPAETIDEFLLHLGFAIGSYKHWEANPPQETNFKKFYRELDKIRNYSEKLSRALTSLPPYFRERIDVGVCMGMLSDKRFAKLPGSPRYWAADWSNSFAAELLALATTSNEVEDHFKQKNKGGGATDSQMTLLARATLAAYADCFNEIPPVTDSHPFARILAEITQIVDRHGAGVFSVMHYVTKVIREVQPDSSAN